jgi:DNA-binding transcriptional MerR regulator
MLRRVKEAADRMGLKPASLRQLEREGLLHPVRDWAGHRRFSDTEIDRVRAELVSGKLCRIQRKSDHETLSE